MIIVVCVREKEWKQFVYPLYVLTYLIFVSNKPETKFMETV